MIRYPRSSGPKNFYCIFKTIQRGTVCVEGGGEGKEFALACTFFKSCPSSLSSSQVGDIAQRKRQQYLLQPQARLFPSGGSGSWRHHAERKEQ